MIQVETQAREHYRDTVIDCARDMLEHGTDRLAEIVAAEGTDTFLPAAYVRESFSLTEPEQKLFYLLVAALYDSSLRVPAYERAEQAGSHSAVFYHNRLHPLVESFLLEQPPVLPDSIRLKLTDKAKRYHSRELLAELGRYLEALTPEDMPAAVVLSGKKGSGRSFLLEQLAADKGLNIIDVDNGCTPDDVTALYLLTVLYQGIVCLNEPAERHPALLSHRFSLLFVRAAKDSALDLNMTTLQREVKALTPDQCKTASVDLLGEDLSFYGCTMGHLMMIKHRQAGEARLGKRVKAAELLTGMTARAGQWEQLRMDKRFDDLILPGAQKKQLTDICAYIRKREQVYLNWGFDRKIPYGRGISMLFYGAPGTGKTLAAGIMANELNLALCRVDLSQLISKYIGETQKNIGKIFEAAKEQRCILFFDEADALFARRSEQNDAQDKYSNAESAYLLQKTESYDGVIILATNLMQNFDEAFKRRIGYMIHFPIPDMAQRKKLWETIFPEQAPVQGLDCDLLSELELTGAGIKNTAVNAAYMAAIGGEVITMTQIMRAAQLEYQKQGKPFSDQLKCMFELGGNT